MDLLTDKEINLELELVEFRLPAKVRTEKRKHWHDERIGPNKIPKVRGCVKEKILNNL